MEFRKDINGLRAIAVILVLLFHFGIPGFGAGFLGVDVFFVISGYLMTGIILRGLERGDFSVLRFYQARIARLYPALLAMVTAVLVFGIVAVDPFALRTMAWHGISALLFYSNILFWTETGYFAAAHDANWFLHTWSLSVEWQFYLVYPVVLLLAQRILGPERRRMLWLLWLGFGLSLLAAIAANVVIDSGKLMSLGFYMLPMRAWEMIAGGLVAAAPQLVGGLRDRTARFAEIAALAMIAAGLVFFSSLTPWPSFNALLPVAATVLVLITNDRNTLLGASSLQAIGRWSYSIYLWHWPLVVGLVYFDVKTPVTVAAAFVAAIMLGAASYAWIEAPARAWLRSGDKRATRHLIAFAAATAGSLLVCVTLMASDGLPGRRPIDNTAYADAVTVQNDFAYPKNRCGGVSRFNGRLRTCEIGTASARDDIIFVGDSFAEMWYSRVEQLEPRLRNHAVVFATLGGCPPIVGLERKDPGNSCAKFHKKAFELAGADRFGTVVLAGMWAAYFTNEDSNSVVCGEAGCRDSGTGTGLALAEENIAAEIRRLRGSGKRVVVLTTSPYPNFDVPDRLRKALFSGQEPRDAWEFDFNAVLANSQPIDSVLRDMRLFGAEIVDVPHELCGGETCPALANGESLYIDRSHLRSSYAEKVGGFLDPYLLDTEISQLRQSLLPVPHRGIGPADQQP